MDMVRKLKDVDTGPELLGHHKRVIEERKKDLRFLQLIIYPLKKNHSINICPLYSRIMEFYRNQTKHDQIMNKLHEYITTEYAIYPNFGIIEFFEFVLTNPYNEPQTVTIIIDDPDIQVVRDSREWRHLKLLHQIYSAVEDNMFHRQEALDPTQTDAIKYPQIYMRPKETINIPFKYQTFRADNRVEGQYVQGRTMYEIKKAVVYFRAEDRNPIAILRLIVDQQPHVVNQTFRFVKDSFRLDLI